MASKIYADTNIFYALGDGRLEPSAFIGADEELWATPLNLLELLAGVRVSNWQGRQAAAQAIIDHAAGIATDPEQHLVSLLDGHEATTEGPWEDACKALAQATSAAELEHGVRDHKKMVVRSVKVPLAELTKKQHYEEFAEGIASACDAWLPGYLEAFQKKQTLPKLSKENRKRFRSAMRSAPFMASIIVNGLAHRYKLVTSDVLRFDDPETCERSVSAFAPYCLVYGAYIAELMTAGRKPEPNDWGDLELFLYLQPGNFVATAEKKWWAFSDSADLGHRVKKVLMRVRR